MSRISIVLINDHAAEYCVPMFESLAKQIDIPAEDVVFIDNASPDESVLIATRYGVNKIYTFENHVDCRGVLYNKGAELAQGEYVLFVHTDVVFSDQFFENLRLNMQDLVDTEFVCFPQIYPDKRLFGFNSLHIRFDSQEMICLQPHVKIPDGYEKYLELSEACFMVKRDVFQFFRFDENYKNSYHDYQLLKDIIINGGNSAAFQNCTVLHYFIELHEKYLTEEFDDRLFRMKNAEMFYIERLNLQGRQRSKESVESGDVASKHHIPASVTVAGNKKRIYHVGAWSGNFGDSILQQSIRTNLQKIADFEIDFQYIHCQKTEFTEELIDKINRDGDMLLLGGGGLVFYRPQDHSKSGWQWNIDINLIDKINIPIVGYGIGYNQFEYDRSNFLPITNFHLQKTVEKCALFSVRNHGSRQCLIERNCNPDKIEVIPDSGMFLEAKPIQIPSLSAERLKIGVNWTTDRQDQTFPPPYEQTMAKFLESLIGLLNEAIKEKNAQIVYIGHMGANFDRHIIGLLKQYLVEPPVVIDEVLQYIYPPSGERAQYLVDVYRQMDVVLGMRGHANIVAFGQNTPFIGMGSHRKVRYFLEDIGRSEYFFDVRPESGRLYTYETMKSLLFRLVDDLQTEKERMKKEWNRQLEIFERFNQKVLNLLQ